MFIRSVYIRDEFGEGPEIFGVLCPPHKVSFIAFLRKIFRNYPKFGGLCPAIFFEKFIEISDEISEFSIFFK